MTPELWITRASASDDGDGLGAARDVLVSIPVGLAAWALVLLALKWLLP